MRTLGEIVDAVRDGERPDYEELRYAVCALEALLTFDRIAFGRLAEAEMEQRKPLLTRSAKWQFGEWLSRVQRARAKSPKEWVGWNNDPENPDFLARRRQTVAFMNRLSTR